MRERTLDGAVHSLLRGRLAGWTVYADRDVTSDTFHLHAVKGYGQACIYHRVDVPMRSLAGPDVAARMSAQVDYLVALCEPPRRTFRIGTGRLQHRSKA